MKWGCCGPLDMASTCKAAGFDFLEVNVQSVLKGDLPSEEWDASAPDPSSFALPVEAANCLVPGSRPVVGGNRDLKGLQDYMQRVANRAQRLGIKRLVFGSGGARKVAEGFPMRQAEAQLVEFVRMAGEICAHHDVVLVIEHLNRNECNTINTLGEAHAIWKQVQHPNAMMLVDSYHWGLERETPASLEGVAKLIRHVHVAEVVDRLEPGAHGPYTGDAGGKPFDFAGFFRILRKAGYNERVSFEVGKWSGPAESVAAKGLAYCKAAWESAGR